MANIVTVERNYINTDAIDPELKFRISEVTLDAGLADGILLGMELHSYNPPNAETAEITEVYGHLSKARIVEIGTDGDKPKAGWQLSTRLMK